MLLDPAAARELLAMSSARTASAQRVKRRVSFHLYSTLLLPSTTVIKFLFFVRLLR